LKEELMDQLSCKTVFSFHLPGGYLVNISEAIVVTWIIMAVLILVSFLMTRRLKINNIGKRQAIAELIVTKLTDIVGKMLGEKGKAFVPYLTTVLIYLGISNIVGIFGFKSPTKDINVTLALALMSIIIVEVAGVYYLGIKKWLHKFVEPIAIVTPFNILDIFTRPLSLCMRLFGNVLGAFVIMELIKIAVPVILPAVFCVYFDIFDGLLQAYVFVFLTSLYISEAIE
jgi:F-type H+-transporting ATPase subunit a